MTMTGEVNNTDYLFMTAPVSGWDILGKSAVLVGCSWSAVVRSNRRATVAQIS